jgi:hypothetical protein
MKYLKIFKSFATNENSQSVTFSEQDKRYIENEIKSLKNINLFEYYENNNGFHIQLMPFDFEKNMNPVTIECEKETDGKIYIQYSQESNHEDYGFTKFPEKVNTLEDAVKEIKNFIQSNQN